MIIRTSTAAAFALFALGAPVFAQGMMTEPMMMESGQAMIVTPSGEMTMGTMAQSAMSMAEENAQPVPEGTVFFLMNGEMMMTSGMELKDGEMMMMK